MADDSAEDVRERLKAALWFAVGKMVDEETLRRNRNVTPQFIGALTEMVWTQIDDILLLARRNSDLHSIIKDSVDQQKAAKAKGSSRR
ncbi:kinetochore component CENP-S-domain-containing protein [Xylariaceae sp. FL0804]|nr:kinetochore component CENP-S-domain-containing protein [Xylariaceae sp. FL0804]